MARIADEVIERIKTEVSLQRLVESYGVALKKHGADRIGRCPFHDDKTPSLVVSPKTNLWHCLGACQTGGSVIDWVMKTEKISLRHALEKLRDDIPALAASSTPPVAKPVAATAPNPSALSADLESHHLLGQVIDYYRQTLLASPEALDYLQSRGLGDHELIERFKLGYANRTLTYQLPPKRHKTGAEIRAQLQALGILRQSGHEHLNGSLVVPVFNRAGQVVEAYGRKLRDDLRKGTPKHLYLPGPHRGVWNGEGLQDHREVILCEALIDAMTFWVHGYKNVTASYGTAGFTDDHLALLQKLNIQRLLIAYDRDQAGNSAAQQLAKKLQAEGVACYRLLFPKGMDVNQYAQEVTPASKSLGMVIRAAEWMGAGPAPEWQLDIEAVQPQQDPQPQTPPTLAANPEPNPRFDAQAEVPVAETPAIPATAVPPTPKNLPEPQQSEHEITIIFGERRYRVRGLQKNTSYEVLKINLLLQCDERVHVDTFDLYSAKCRQGFVRMAAAECGIENKVIQRDLGQLLLQLETLQDQTIQEALKPKALASYRMEDDDRKEAFTLLRDPTLAQRIVSDYAQIGLVGEPANALMGYLAAVSRKLKTPLAIIVQSTSAAGKSALMDAVLKMVPEEDKVHYSAMTGQSLFYLGETNLKHKILGIAEEEGVRQAAYALKLLQSQGELTIASTSKDPHSGKLVTEEYRVEGPVMLFLTTTAIDLDEELLNRCVVLTINESRAQTAAIQQRQRQARTLDGLLANHQADRLIRQHQNAQRLLRPLAVVNPYAQQLRFADSRTRTRRDHEKYLTLIDSITLLHQYQRGIKTVAHNAQQIDYIETTLDDIALANDLAHDILGRSLDELPPPTRTLLQHLHTLVAQKVKTESLRQTEVRFTRREVREAAGLSDKQVRVHLGRLVELEYVLAHHGRNGQRFVYELVLDGELETNQAQLIGLIDVEQLRKHKKTAPTTDNLVASGSNLVGSSWPASGQLVAT
ncbi:CHC2 zinc finger domain-containing protein [uncultured Microbulbifer sp.]|uniref:CHC2 zinc finger domain-containing protein n=1 Tax=uncultured Microbulbifer sp. TaxID=348147 RepID=UPI002637F4DA|nr:CHC2 zinc finger domain-containing protein [uncultured Microbulbifer sp.]